MTNLNKNEGKKIQKKNSKKNSKWPTKIKARFPAPPILNIFLQKIYGLVLGLVRLIDGMVGIGVALVWHWCGSTYMVVRLSDVS